MTLHRSVLPPRKAPRAPSNPVDSAVLAIVVAWVALCIGPLIVTLCEELGR